MTNLEVLIHPARLRMIQYLTIHKRATANELITALGNVSKASVYNHMKVLEENQIVDVVQENRIRGTVEKVYQLRKTEQNKDFHSIMTFLFSLMADFQHYYEEKSDPAEDMLFAGRDCFFLTDEEFHQFYRDYEKLCEHYFGFHSPGAKVRTVSIVSSPAKSEKEEEANE